MRFLFVLPLLFSMIVSALAESQTAAPVSQMPPVLLSPSAATTPTQPSGWLSPTRPATDTTITVTPLRQLEAEPSTEELNKPIVPEADKARTSSKNGVKAKIAVKSEVNQKKKKASASKNNADKTSDDDGEPLKIESVLTKELRSQDQTQRADNTLQMLFSLVELQKTLKQQIAVTTKKLKVSRSESEKQDLQEELVQLDKQLNETSVDFERLATGVDSDVFSDKQATQFSWKEELSTLIEPSLKELKQLTAKARQKSDLKDTIAIYEKQSTTAHEAVDHIEHLIDQAKDNKVKNYLNELLPAWKNMEKRIDGKLDLAKQELAQLEADDVSILQSTGRSIRDFFRARGWFLLIALGVFVGLLLGIRLLARLLFHFLPSARKENRPAHIRFLGVFLQFFSIFAAISGLIAALYLAEDWLLLSGAIVLMLGMVWGVRQTLPKMWQQARLMLNMGSIREGERLTYQNVPWKVMTINVFCKLYNPTMGCYLRVPIENMIGLVSRPYALDEPWFPCKTGDWVAIDGKPNAKVVSLSHEMVELVELGGRKIVYPTGDFLGLAPANFSTNFFIRVVFGLSYDLQKEITTTVLDKLQAFIERKFEEHHFSEGCLSLSVDFLQAGASSLDVVIFANMRGDQAPSIGKIERSISRWCVECCNLNNWEIPFPQMTVHLPDQSGK